MGSVFQNGFADTANLHQVAVTYIKPPRELAVEFENDPSVQGVTLTQSPNVAFQFSALVKQ